MGAADHLTMLPVRSLAVRYRVLFFGLLLAAASSAAAQQTILDLDPGKTSVKFSLGDVLHTVHGAFRLQRGRLELEPMSGLVSGEIVVDARSGDSGNSIRDRKMHREILQSDQFPEISFRPDRIEGPVVSPGQSSVKVHGIFRIHGVDREITVPAGVELAADHWTAKVHFTVPYAKWGMKNPSTLFLRVSDSVEIDLTAGGSVTQKASSIGGKP